jgi:CO/xanthine dehydrogenase Mo-binding subunit
MRPEELRPRQERNAVDGAALDALAEEGAGAQLVIGRRNRKIDGYGKVTGAAVYTDDMALPGMLHGKILRSPHPHANILSIDTSGAEALPGVHAVVTGREMPVTYCVIPWTRDEYPLCVDRVRYIGDGVAAVAAVDEETANRALRLIRVEYELLEPIFEPERALDADAPQIHEAGKPGRNGNITKHVHLEFGDVDAALADSDVVIDDEYFFQGSTHTPIEPHCAIGWYDPTGKLTVWSATQVPHYLHRELARVLDLDVARIRVVQPAVGGAFGGKSEPFDLEFCVAALSRKCGRPVKILYTREEVFYSHRGRHPMKMKYRTGATRDGHIRAVDGKLLLDGGAYASFGLVTAYYSGQLLTAPYSFDTYRFDSTRVYTNKPPCGPKRGPGSVQPRLGFEVQLDKLSDRLNIDPIELRRRNFLGSNTRTINELRMTSNGFMACLGPAFRSASSDPAA